MTSHHERHRPALEAVVAGQHLDAVARLARTLGVRVDPAGGPRMMRSRLVDGEATFAEALHALGPRTDQVVRVRFATAPHEEAPGAAAARVPQVGWVQVTASATADPVLATAVALEAEAEAGPGPEEPGSSALVRYHSGARAILRLPRHDGQDGQDVVFAKVFSDDQGAALHDALSDLAAAVRRERLPLRVPQPSGYDPERRVLWFEAVSGVAAAELLAGQGGVALARRIGVALGRFHASGLLPGRDAAHENLERAERRTQEAVAMVPGVGERLHRLLDAGRPRPGDPPARLVPVHGSPMPGEWLVADGLDLGLVDLDRYARAEPEYDVSGFLVAARKHGPQVLEAFLAAYRSAAGPLDEAAYRRHLALRLVGSVHRATRTLRPDGDRKAAKVLAQAEREVAVPLPG